MCVEIRRGAYGLPQAEVLAHSQLTKHLNEAGCSEALTTPSTWNQKWIPIIFTLVVNDFGAECVGEEHDNHLTQTPQTHYDVAEDWPGNKFLGIDLDWDYAKKNTSIINEKIFHHCPSAFLT